jgi:hypothetical protein
MPDSATVQRENNAREARVRRVIARQGYRLEKCRARNPEHPRFGTYWILDPYTNPVEAGDTNWGYGMSLKDVENWVEED